MTGEYLRDKVVLIAGGGSGAGLVLATKAAAAGAIVHLVGRSGDKLAAAKRSVGGKTEVHEADISDEAQVEAVAASIPKVDHLVTTAADLVFKPFLELEDGDIERVLASKLWGPTYLVRHLAGKLAVDGSITFFSGSAAYKASAGASIVAAANAALGGLARTLAVELAPIRVNVISPGIFDGSTWDFLDADARATTLDEIGKSIPTGRVGTADELADAAMFVMGNAFTTGTVLQIDGGLNA